VLFPLLLPPLLLLGLTFCKYLGSVVEQDTVQVLPVHAVQTPDVLGLYPALQRTQEFVKKLY